MKTATILLAALWLGGCVSDGPGLSTNPNTPAAKMMKEGEDPDKPKQLCVDTSEGTQSKTVCY